ncbi:hypothetical protein [Polaribacter porphyrae]|uniref:Uncharacterized protein n=1 Tax=Polaribacter porphyrae TaxID=1137780 RepID=A0A2S7WPU5_9FLAO|nr:hypothetical protein [Polaribacter porphyrae]PQJ79627.1 hypothetical protein BTO18_10780 [Polaribacter porphyrae]
MSFTSHMITSLKHNRRKRISAFEKIKNFKEGNNIQVSFDGKATPCQLKNIREKLSDENRKRKIKNILIFIVGMSTIIYFAGFAKY